MTLARLVGVLALCGVSYLLGYLAAYRRARAATREIEERYTRITGDTRFRTPVAHNPGMARSTRGHYKNRRRWSVHE